MQNALSVVMITKDAGGLLSSSLESVKHIADEIIIVDDGSSDNTLEIARRYKAKIFLHHEVDLGKQKAFALSKANNVWALNLDADEIVSKQLEKEIKQTVHDKNSAFDGYLIAYQNHYLGKPINYGGENYEMIRLIRTQKAIMDPALVHEKLRVASGNIGRLKGKIEHYSYQNLGQMFGKFTDYAFREARERKKRGEKAHATHILTYPLHMFWARFIKDKGYKDGLFRIPLDLGFAYMEFLVQVYLLFP